MLIVIKCELKVKSNLLVFNFFINFFLTLLLPGITKE